MNNKELGVAMMMQRVKNLDASNKAIDLLFGKQHNKEEADDAFFRVSHFLVFHHCECAPE